jgi:hypothetical protein
MAIELNDGSRIAAPVIRQQRLGEVAYLAIVRPEQRDRLRLILKAKGFGEWIEARRQHRRGRLNVGDVLVLETRWAQQYDQDGNPSGPPAAGDPALGWRRLRR